MSRNVMQKLMDAGKRLPPHKFEHYMIPKILPHNTTPSDQGASLIEVFVDDFIGATNKLHKGNLQHLSRAMLHGLHL
eukprot:8536534-Ditylum_brightwellii.AAC.1